MVSRFIPDIIKKCLFETGSACLPGIGMLRLNREPASFDGDRKNILPHNFNLDFESGATCHNSIATWIQHSYGLTNAQTDAALKSLEKEVIDSLSSGSGSFYLDGLGTFYMIDGNPTFIASEAANQWFSKGLSVVLTSPIQKTVVAPPTIVTSTETLIAPSREKEGRNLLRWLPFLIVLSLLTIAFKYYLDHKKDLTRVEKKTIIVPPIDTSDSVEMDNKIGEGSTVIESESTLIDNIGDTFNMKSITDKKALRISKKNNAETAYSPMYSEEEQCVIITGFFTDQNNAEKMKELLIKRNFEVYQESIGTGQRIGVKFDCGNQDLRKKIKNIRDSIAKEAWYLVPNVSIQ